MRAGFYGLPFCWCIPAALLCCCRVCAETCVRVSAFVWDVPWRYLWVSAGQDDLHGWRRIRRRIQRRPKKRAGPLVVAQPFLPLTALRWLLRLALLLVLALPVVGITLYVNVLKYIYFNICVCIYVSSPFTSVVVCVFLRLCGMCRGIIRGRAQGKMTDKSGTVYEGEYKGGKRTGQVRWLTPTPFCPRGAALASEACFVAGAVAACVEHHIICECIYIYLD